MFVQNRRVPSELLCDQLCHRSTEQCGLVMVETCFLIAQLLGRAAVGWEGHSLLPCHAVLGSGLEQEAKGCDGLQSVVQCGAFGLTVLF